MDNRKKILFLVTQSEFGGAQRFIYELVSNINRYEIVVSAGPEGDDENGLLNLLSNRGIKVERLKNLRRSVNPFFDLLGFFEIRKLLKKEKPDILFLCSSKAGFLGAWAGKNKVNKIIYRIGGWSFNDPRCFLINHYLRFIEKFSAKWKDYIINNAEPDRQQAIKLGIKPKKEILTIHNGIDIEKMEFLDREEAKQKLINLISNYSNLSNQIPNSNDIIVGTIANDYPAKGLKYLREAEKKLSEFKIVILSGIPNAHKYLKAFDVFVLPSVKEGFPWVVLEAMAAEVPIIATKVGAVPDIIQNNENGILIEPGKPEKIVEAVQKLLKDKHLQDKLINNAKKTVTEKFNLSEMIKQYENLFSVN